MAFILNGQLVDGDHPTLPIVNNSSFWYGDGFFDAIKFSNNKIHFESYHWERLVNSCRILKMQNPFNHQQEFVQQIHILAQQYPNASLRIKIILWRHNSYQYKPANNTTEYLITAKTDTNSHYELNNSGLGLVTYTENLKSKSILGNIKSTSSALYVLATQYAQAMKMDDAVIFNTDLHPIETCRMNIFLIKNGDLLTPPLSEGCLDGIMRKVIINGCINYGVHLKETPIQMKDLENCDGMFVTSSIQGVQWVNKVNDVNFLFPPMVTILHQHINQQMLVE